MHDRSHSVTLLPVHLPGVRDIAFDDGDDIDLLDQVLNCPSKLEAFFALNREHRNARDLYYVQIPEYYNWKTATGTWAPRQVASKMIGSVYAVSPNDPQLEKYLERPCL